MGLPVTASLFTPTGCRRFRELVPGADCSLAPLDHPWVVDRVLSSLDPIALVLVETELWPFLISAASLRDVPIAVLSGRLSDRSFENYRRALPFFSPRLARIDRIGARSELDAERFLALGARPECVEVTGDLKLEPLEPSAGSPPDWDAILGGCMAFVAGSTHEGEEVAALEALSRCEREGLAVGLVLAPRHLTRVENVIEAVKRAGRTPRLRSQIGTSTLQAGEVLVLDTLGELPHCYAQAQAAFVGGTLIGKGGHNLLEPAQYGVPVCFGPHTENVRGSAELLEASGAGFRVHDAKELGDRVFDVLKWEGRHPAAEAGRKMIESHRGSLARSLDLVADLLEGRGQ